MRLTGRGWSVLVASGVLLALLLTLLVVSGRSLLPSASECTMTVGDRVEELSAKEAQRLTATAADSLRRGRPLDRSLARRLGEASLSCRHGGAWTREADRLGERGLTARAERVHRDLERAFGPQRLGGFAPGGVREGHMPGSAHYDGRAIDVFFRPINRRNQARGWVVAHYLVAHADRLEVDTVIFDGRIWTARRSGEGWRAYQPNIAGRSKQVARVLEHRDHVHLDVAD